MAARETEPKRTKKEGTLRGLFEQLAGTRRADGRRYTNEDYMALFFPQVWAKSLQEQLKGSYSAQLSWFLNGDERNKAVGRQLVQELKKEGDSFFSQTQARCRDVLYRDGRPALPAAETAQILGRFLQGLFYKIQFYKESDGPSVKEKQELQSRLARCAEEDPAKALAKCVLTAGVGSLMTLDLLRSLWNEDEPAPMEEKAFQKRTPPDQLRYIGLLRREGRREEAAEYLRRAVEGLPVKKSLSEDQARLLYELGSVLKQGDGCLCQPEEAFDCFQRAAGAGFGPACYELAQCLQYGVGCASDPEEAQGQYEAAAQAGHPAACRLLGQRAKEAGDLSKADAYFRKGARPEEPQSGDPECQYQLSLILGQEQPEDAEKWLERAAKSGHAQALRKLKRPLDTGEEGRGEPAGAPGLCLLDGDAPRNQMLARSLPGGGWRVVLCQGEGTFDGLERELAQKGTALVCSSAPAADALEEVWPEWSSRSDGAPLLLAFLGEREEDNLEGALSLLERLLPLLDRTEDRRTLAGRLRLYVRARQDPAAALLDACLSGTEGYDVPVRLVDPDQAAAQELLSTTPLFVPSLQNPEEKHLQLVLLGGSPCALWVVREAIAAAYLEEYPLHIAVLAPDAAGLEKRFRQLCPGLYDRSGTSQIQPQFLEADLEALPLCPEAAGETEEAVEAALARGNYFVAAQEDDRKNLELGMALRRGLLARDPAFRRLPVIAVRCREERTARIARTLSVGASQPFGYQWYANYALSFFGAERRLYSYAALEGDLLEKRAIAIHASYYGVSAGEAPTQAALHDYYGSQYNRDSSRLAALHLIYRAFAAGVYLTDWHFYGSAQAEEELGRRYRAWLEDPALGKERLERAAQAEHMRWNYFMYTRGWRQAGLAQLAAYLDLGNPRQQLELARLHPYLCSWEMLSENWERVSRMVHDHNPQKNLPDPRDYDRESVRSTPDFLAPGPAE